MKQTDTTTTESAVQRYVKRKLNGEAVETLILVMLGLMLVYTMLRVGPRPTTGLEASHDGTWAHQRNVLLVLVELTLIMILWQLYRIGGALEGDDD